MKKSGTPTQRRRSDVFGKEKVQAKLDILEKTMEETVELLEDKEKTLQLAAEIGQALSEQEEILQQQVPTVFNLETLMNDFFCSSKKKAK